MPVLLPQQVMQQDYNSYPYNIQQPTGQTIPQPTVTALNGLSADAFTAQYTSAVDAYSAQLPAFASVFNDVKNRIQDINSAINVLINKFKQPEYNHFKVSELESGIRNILSSNNLDTLFSNIPSDLNDLPDWLVNTETAASSAITELNALAQSQSIFTSWSTDVEQVVNRVIAEFKVSDFNKYYIDFSRYSSLPAVASAFDRLMTELKNAINQEAVIASPQWSTIAGMTLELTPTEVASIQEGIRQIIISDFAASMNQWVAIPKIAIPQSDFVRFQSLVNANGWFDDVNDLLAFMTTIIKFYEGYEETSNILFANVLNTANSPFNQSLFEFRISFGTPIPVTTPGSSLKTVPINFTITSKEDARQTLTVTKDITVDDSTRVTMALRELTGIIPEYQPTLDTTSQSYIDQIETPGVDAYHIGDLINLPTDFIYWAVGEGFNENINEELSALLMKFGTDVGFDWSISKDANDQWWFNCILSDTDSSDGTDQPATFSVKMSIKTPSDNVNEAIDNNKASIMNAKVYESELDDTQSLINRLLSPEFIANVNAVAPVGWDVVSHTRVVVDTDVNGEVTKVSLEIDLPDSSDPAQIIPLTISPFFSPSDELLNRLFGKLKPHGIEDPNNPGTFITYSIGDTLDQSQLDQIFPTLFVGDPANGIDSIIEQFSKWGLTATMVGAVQMVTVPNSQRIDADNDGVIDLESVVGISLEVLDNTIDQPVILNLRINVEVATEEYIDEQIRKVNDAYAGAQYSIDSWDGTDKDGNVIVSDPNKLRDIKQSAKDALDVIKQEFDEQGAPLMQTLVGRAEGEVDAVRDRYLARIGKVLSERNIPQVEQPEIPKDMTKLSKILLLATSSLAGVGGVMALGNAFTIFTTNRKLKKSESIVRVKSKKTGILSLSIAIILIGISVGMFIYLFVNQGGL